MRKDKLILHTHLVTGVEEILCQNLNTYHDSYEIMYFKAVSQSQKHQMMTPYVQVDKRQNSEKGKYIKDPHRIGYFDYNSNLYGYYVFDPEKDFVEDNISKSLTRKITRNIISHYDPFTSIL